MYTNIFIIDDDLIFRLITTTMIEMIEVSSLKLHECEDGEIGLNALNKLSNTEEKVIIFLDINMPVLNGWGFLDKLKQNEYFNIKDISVYIFSSSTDESDIEKSNTYDVVKQFIQKPMELSTIKTILSELNL